MTCEEGAELYVGNDVLIFVSDLHQDEPPYTSITDATVIGQVFDSDGAQVGADIPMVWNDDASSYRGTIQSTLPLIAGEDYIIIYKASAGGLDAKWQEVKRAKVRTP